MNVRVALLVALALTAPVFAGCLSGTNLDVASLQAPVWDAGYSWSYATESQGLRVSEGDEGRSTSEFTQEGIINRTVLNTTQSFGDVPVYITEQDAGVQGDMGPGVGGVPNRGVTAVARDDLRPVAHGWSWTERVCGLPVMYPVDEPGVLRFPMDLGDTWWHERYDLRFDFEVRGVETVDVPAGSFEAVRIHVDVTPVAPPATESDSEMSGSSEFVGDEFTEFDVQQDYWYAPAARNLVKVVMTSEVTFDEGSERYSMETRSTVALAEYDLTRGTEVEVPLPEPVTPGVHKVRERYGIVTDTAFPTDIGALDEGAVARFGIDVRETMMPSVEPPMMEAPEGPYDHESSYSIPEPDFVFVEETMRVGDVPAVGPYDHERFQAVWFLMRSGTDEEVRIVADVLELPLDQVEWYTLRFELQPVEVPDPVDPDCHRYVPESPPAQAWAEFHTFYNATYEVDVPMGDPVEIELDELPIGARYATLMGHYAMTHDNPPLRDRAYPVGGSSGDSAGGDEGTFEFWFEEGTSHVIAWRAEGTSAQGIGDAPLVAGHSAIIEVSVVPG